MELESLNWTFVIDTFLLLLIGIGPKIALVPFLEATKQMPQAGIVILVTTSAEAASVAVFAVTLGILILVLALDVVVFRWAVQVSSHLDASRMLVTEKVFGFLLAALGVQLALDGLADLGVIHLTGH
jgi:MarC family integral membrane protein